MLGFSVKNIGDTGGINSLAVVGYGKDCAAFFSGYLYTNRRGTAGMANGIFHQIDEYLFDQGGIHGNNQHFLRNRNIYNGIGKTLANPTDSLTYNFFYDFILLFQIGCAACNFRNRKQILHHVNQPFCIMLDIH